MEPRNPLMRKKGRAPKKTGAPQQRSRIATVATNVREDRSTRICFWAVFGAAFLVRLLYLFQIQSIPLFYNLAGDGRTYDEWAQRIAAGDWLGSGVFYQAPLYPYFLGVLQKIVGHELWIVRLVQISLGALSCALICRIGIRLFSRRAGIAAGLILTFYAPAIFFDGLIEKSILDILLLSALVFVAYCFDDDTGHRLKWLLVGVLLGLLAL